MQPRQQETSLGPAALARRLRALRHGWPGSRVTQGMVADAFGASTALISGWENLSNPSVPPQTRLRSYATLFATRRSLQDDQLRILPDDELTADELAARDELYTELLVLRDAAGESGLDVAEPRRGSWHFPDGAPIRLVCGTLPERHRGDYASVDSPNYSQLHRLADPDALVELWGHVRMVNPDSDVRFLFAADMRADDLTAHVVLIGGLEWNPAARFFAQIADLPVKQVDDENVEDGEVFEIEREGRKRRFLPTFLEGDPALGLIEDVALFARMRNPNFPQRTLTVCNGVFSRGVLGAVRILTDAQLREPNEAYLHERFGDRPEYGLLLRVPVFGREISTPDLSNDYHRLYVWTGSEGPG
ncbi:MAG TPA: hypothetical protein VH573_17385 [Mycobacteriales bacterium]